MKFLPTKIFVDFFIKFTILFLVLETNTLSLSKKGKSQVHKTASNNPFEKDLQSLSSSIIQNEIPQEAVKLVTEISDRIGPRLWGSPALELTIEFLKKKLENEGFQNVHKQEITDVRHWVRGNESLTLLSPRPTPTNLRVIGLGGTVPGDVTSSIVMFTNLSDLEKLSGSNALKGKIAFINIPFTRYSVTINVRVHGTNLASKAGAEACIIRSVAPVTFGHPHTGVLKYEEGTRKIPAGSISHEDANLLARLVSHGENVVLHLHLESEEKPKTKSSNLIAEFPGTDLPNEVIILGGHLDSWDAGPMTGTLDDLTGTVVCIQAVNALIKSGLKTRRTIRFIGYSGEEFLDKKMGSNQYFESLRKSGEIKNVKFALESDLGNSKALGLGVYGKDKQFNQVKSFLNNYFPTMGLYPNKGSNEDLLSLLDLDIPVTNLYTEGSDSENTDFDKEKWLNMKVKDAFHEYFIYHHSGLDGVDYLNKEGIRDNIITLASLFYVLGNVETI